MKDLQRLIIDILSSGYNFRIIEHRDYKGDSIWGLYKSYDNLNHILLFMDVNGITQGHESIINEIKGQDGYDKPIKINFILIDTPEELLQFAQHRQHIYEEENAFIELILIDKDSGKIINYDENSHELVTFIQNVITDRAKPKVTKRGKENHIITNILIGLNIIIFALTVIVSAILSGDIYNISNLINSLLNIDNRVLLIFGAKYNPLINNGEYYRLLTAMFLHGGLVHIAFNMYALKSLGPFVEAIYGKLRFLIIYILGGLASTLLSYKFSEGLSVGASGAIFALLGCALVFGVKKRRNLGKGFLNNIIQVIAINLILGFTVSNIDNYGHIGGLIGGILISFIMSLPKKR